MDKDIAIMFFQKPKNLCTFQKSIYKEILKNMKNHFPSALSTMCFEQNTSVLEREFSGGFS